MSRTEKEMKTAKVTSLKKLLAVLSQQKKRRRRVVLTNGCFDIVHAGHVRYLKKAASLGDILVVGLNSDKSVRQIKGETRPIVPEKERAEVIGALECVDHVVLFDEATPIKLIEAIKPDVLVKGSDWAAQDIVGADVVKEKGGKVRRISLVKGRSTTNIIKKILKLHKK